MKVVFVILGPGLYRGGVNIHGPLADYGILIAEVVVWVVLWCFFYCKIARAPAQPFERTSRPNAGVMSYVCSLYLILASFNYWNLQKRLARKRATQMSCTKTCNASALHALTKEFVGFVPSAYALHVFVQRICIADFVQVFFTSSTN